MPSTRTYAAALTALAASGVLVAANAQAGPGFGDWTAPASIESLPGSAHNVNTPAVDGCVTQSRDGLTIYFNSNRTGNQDLYRATRPDTDSGFGAPERLPSEINTSADEFCPTITVSGRLYFSRASATDPGNLMVTRERQDGSWDDPVMLGANINSPLMDESATFFENEAGQSVMLFSRRRPDGSGGKIFQSVNGGAAEQMGGGLASAGSDNRPNVTRDGLRIYFDSVRPGGLGGPDLYTATRDSTDQPFGPATALAALNSPAFDARPSLSFDGSQLLFSSARTGSKSAAPDIWFTERDRSHPGPKVISF